MFGVICVFLFGGSGSVIAAPTLQLAHTSETFLINDKPAYDNAYFSDITFWFRVPRPEISADKDVKGFLTIKKGTYSYFDKDENLIDVHNQDKTFDVKYAYGDEKVVMFYPMVADKPVFFHKLADGGLQNKVFSWDIPGNSGNSTVHNFRTTQQQITSYAPYVEISENNLIVRMVNPSDMGKALRLPDKSRYYIEVFGRGDYKPIYSSGKWEEFDSAYAKTIPLSSEDINNTALIQVAAKIFENAVDPGYEYRYSWDFNRTAKSDEGIDNAEAAKPLRLKVGEETVLDVVLKQDYYVFFNAYQSERFKNPVFIGDKSVLQSSWSYDKATRTYSVTLKGLKDGVTDVSVYYQKNHIDYQSIPLKVTVGSGGAPEHSSSGSGCNAGFAGLAVLALSVIILRKKS